MARRGSASLRHEPEPGSARDAWRDAVERAGKPAPWSPEVWTLDDDDSVRVVDDLVSGDVVELPGNPMAPTAPSPPAGVAPVSTGWRRNEPADRPTLISPEGPRNRATQTVPQANRYPLEADEGFDDAGGDAGRLRGIPKPVAAELNAAAGSKAGPRLANKMADASRAFQRERYQEAARILRDVVEMAPTSASAHELLGLSLYRMGRWGQAVKELDAFREATGSVDQHPVLADCHRALGHRHVVAELWEELKEGSPSAELVAEGRIVMAATLADNQDLAGAIALLERSVAKTVRQPRDHHLRQWYALADLYERAGDVPHALSLFRRVADHDPEFVDVLDRLEILT